MTRFFTLLQQSCKANDWTHRHRFRGGGGAGGRRPLGSNTEGGEICLAPSVFWQVIPTWQQEIRNSELRYTRMRRRPFYTFFY